MFRNIKKVFWVILVGLPLSSCGTQTGNPPTIGPKDLLKDNAIVTRFLNEMVIEIIDGVSTGDYSYQPQGSRVTSQNRCGAVGSQFGLIRSIESNHSVSEKASIWTSDSQLSIERTLNHMWQQGMSDIACQIDLTSNDFGDFSNPVTLNSLDSESKSRLVNLTYVADNRQFSYQSTHIKNGSRQLILSQNDGGDLNGNLSQAFTHQMVGLSSAGIQTSLAFSTELTDLRFNISLQNDGFSRYLLPEGSFKVTDSDNEETLAEFNLENLTFSAGSCLPSTGRLYGRFTAGTVDQEFSINFDGSTPESFALADNSIVFAPTGCTLNER